jgi:hypothetical protein
MALLMLDSSGLRHVCAAAVEGSWWRWKLLLLRSTSVVCSATNHLLSSVLALVVVEASSCSLDRCLGDAPVGGNQAMRVNCSGRCRTSVLLDLLNRSLVEDSCMAGTVFLG